MLGGTYAPGMSAVDVNGEGWEDLTFGNDLHGIDLYLKDSLGFALHPVELGLVPGDCTPKGVVWADFDNDADQDLFPWIDEELDGRREVYITGMDEAVFLKDTGGYSFVDRARQYACRMS